MIIVGGWSGGLNLPRWKEGFALDRGALFAFLVVMVVVVVVDGEIGSGVLFGVVRVGLVSEEGMTRLCHHAKK